MFVFVLQIASVMKEKTFKRVLWDVVRCGLREGKKGAAEDALVGIPTTERQEPQSDSTMERRE